MGENPLLNMMPDFCRKEKPYMLGTTSCVSRCGGVLCTHSTLWMWRTVRQTNNRGFASSDVPPCEGRSTNAFLAYIYLVLADKRLYATVQIRGIDYSTCIYGIPLESLQATEADKIPSCFWRDFFLLGFYPFFNVSLPCLCAKAWFVGLNLLHCHLFVSFSDESLWGTVGCLVRPRRGRWRMRRQ